MITSNGKGFSWRLAHWHSKPLHTYPFRNADLAFSGCVFSKFGVVNVVGAICIVVVFGIYRYVFIIICWKPEMQSLLCPLEEVIGICRWSWFVGWTYTCWFGEAHCGGLVYCECYASKQVVMSTEVSHLLDGFEWTTSQRETEDESAGNIQEEVWGIEWCHL